MKQKRVILLLVLAVVAVLFLHSQQRREVQVWPQTPQPLPHVDPSNAKVIKPSLEKTKDVVVSESIKNIMNPRLSWQQRYQALYSLRQGMTAAENEALVKYLRENAAGPGSPVNNAFWNEVMGILVFQREPMPELAGVMMELYGSLDINGVLKDYVVQHAALFYQELDRAPQQVASLNRRVLEDLLFLALGETDSTIAGTALLGLARLASAYPEIDGYRVKALALTTALDGNASELSRMTALQVCAECNMQEVLPFCLSAVDADYSIMIRMSAIAAIGKLGGPAEMNRLAPCLQNQDERIKMVAVQAIKRLQEKAKTTP